MKLQLRIITALCLSLALWSAMPVLAQNNDPPGRVARLSYMSGSVSFEPAGENDWSLATLNYPLTGGDRLWTDKDARAELETGNLAIRLSDQTDLTTTTLNDQLIRLGLGREPFASRLSNCIRATKSKWILPLRPLPSLRPGAIESNPTLTRTARSSRSTGEKCRLRETISTRPCVAARPLS